MTNTHLETTGVTRRLVRYRPQAAKDEIQIEYADQGAGPVVCMLPSLARSGRDYDVVARHLQAQGLRVLRPEPRGIGQSRGPMQGLTLHDFAADVAAVIDHEATGPVVVVGHAWGSQPARMLAADRPDLVRGVVMAAASAGKLPPGSDEMPYGRLRDAIDGAGDARLSRSSAWTACAAPSLPRDMTPAPGWTGGTPRPMKRKAMHGASRPSMTTSAQERPFPYWTFGPNMTRS
ncbi:alpha/beta fold hydrolase [Delftia tsuruhatensis]